MRFNREIGLRAVSASVLFLFVLGSVIPLLSIPDPAVGTIQIQNGDLTVDGSSSTISGKTWRINGNISVVNGGSLTFRNCYIEIASDIGLDGTIDTTDDNIHNISVDGGSKLVFDNCTLTSATTQLYPYLRTDINVHGSTIYFIDSTVQCPGNLSAHRSNVFINSSVFKKMPSLPSTVTDSDYNDDGMSYLFNSSKVYIADSEIKDTYEYSGNTASPIWVANSRLTVFESYIDIDFRDVSEMDKHNYLNITDGGKAYLFGMRVDQGEQYPPLGPAIVCRGSSSEATIFRFVEMHAFDAIGIPLPNADFTLYYADNGTGNELAALPPQEYFTYSGKNAGNFLDVNDDGTAVIPVRSDIGDAQSMPNMDFMGRYKVQGTAPMSGGVTTYMLLEGYPTFYNATGPSLVFNVTFGDLVSTDPSTNNYYDASSKDILVSYKTVNLTGSTSVKNGRVFPSYFGQAGSITVSDFGVLNIRNTYLDILQDANTHYYIMVESNAILNLDNVTIGSLDGEPLNIYVKGAPSTQPRIYATNTNLNINVICIRNFGDLHLMNSEINGSLNAIGGNVIIDAKDSNFINGSFIIDDTDTTIENCIINTTAISIVDSTFRASNVTIFSPLTFENSMEGNLSNVIFKNVNGETIVVKDSAVVSVYYWVKVKVLDTFKNPLPSAVVRAYGFNGFAIGTTPFSTDVSNLTGVAYLNLLEKIITSSASDYKGNYYINASYKGYSSRGYGGTRSSSAVTGGSMEINITIDGAPNLVPSNITTNGSLIQGNNIEVLATVSNNGEFATSNVDVELENSGFVIGTQTISLLNSSQSTILKFPWNAQYGQNMLKVTVDKGNNIGERNENDNVVERPITVGYGPDLYPIVEFSQDTPSVGEDIQLIAKIGNLGDYDTEGHDVKVEFFIGSPIDQNRINVTYIPPVRETQFTSVYANYTPMQVGFEQVYVKVTSYYDASDINDINSSTLEVRSPPDLNIHNSDIVFSNPGPIGVGQQIDVNVTVHNDGKSDAHNVVVRIYQDELLPGNMLGEEHTFQSISAMGSTYIEFTWSSPSPNSYTIIAVVDPENSVNESEENNNRGENTILVGDLPDLKFDVDTLEFSPGSTITEGDILVVNIDVSNSGGTKATFVVVQFYIDTLYNPIGEFMLNLSNDESRSLIVYWSTIELVGSEELIGDHQLFGVIDPDNNIVESNENNNLINSSTIGSKISILSKADLAVTSEDISFSKVGPLENGENITIYATIHNWGQTPAKKVSVEFYDGDPTNNGDLIEWRDIQPTAEIDELPGGQTETITVVWNTLGSGGSRDIYVVLDREEKIDELQLNNNRAFAPIYVKTAPDLSVSWANLSIQQNGVIIENIGKDQQVHIVGKIYNNGDTDASDVLVAAFNGDPELEGQISTTISEMRVNIPGNGYYEFSIPYTTIKNQANDISESQRLYVFVDKLNEFAELDEMDNSAYTTLTILGLDTTPDLYTTNETLELSENEDNIFQGDSVYQGSNISLKINITNKGGVGTSQFTVSIFRSNPIKAGGIDFTDVITNITVPGLEADPDKPLYLDGSDGAYFTAENIGVKNMYYVLVDSFRNITEYDESNNLLSFNLTVQSKPDLTIALNIEKTDYHTGDQVSVTVTIGNSGKGAYIPVQCTLGGEKMSGDPSTFVSTNGTSQLTYTGKVNSAGTFKIIATVDPNGEVPETNEGNNVDVQNIKVTKVVGISAYLPVIIIVVVIVLLVLGAIVAAVYFLVIRKTSENFAECSECGAQMPLDATTCPNCGAEFGDEVECGNCGHLMSINDPICPNCGAVFSEDATAKPPTDQPPKPEEPQAIGEQPAQPAAPPTPGEEVGAAAGLDDIVEGQGAADGEDVAECYMCGSIIPLSAPICPVCGAEFE